MNLPKSGTHKSCENSVWDVLTRSRSIDILGATLETLSGATNSSLSISVREAAIIVDTNTFFRLPNHQDHDTVVDYLANVHRGLLIVPGQVYQELINNYIGVSASSGDVIRNKLNPLKSAIAKELDNQDILEEIQSVLDDVIDSRLGFIAEGFVATLTADMDQLKDRIVTSFVDRDRFASLAKIRNDTKTPPGFKDQLHGDFFFLGRCITEYIGAS
ncbi:hypothetical protein QPK87_37405 [Kamptonema cortianum]|nr:hypothetical protein [Geitlerinema splendidum]MDK3162185.1 hypothetical protein [Kamptonema cortianum]